MPAGMSAPGHHDRRVIAEHVEPDAMSFGELPPAKTCAFHFFEESGHRTIAIHLNWAWEWSNTSMLLVFVE